MTRDDYCRLLRVAMEFDERRDRLGVALREHLAPESGVVCVSFGEGLLSSYLDMLEEAVGDDAYSAASGHGSWTRWFLYGIKPKTARIGGREYIVRSPEDLFDVIVAWKEIQLQDHGYAQEDRTRRQEGAEERGGSALPDEGAAAGEQAHPDTGWGGHDDDRPSVGPADRGAEEGYRPF